MQREGWYRRHLKRQETALAVLNSHGPMQAAASQSAFKIFNHTFAILSPHIFGSNFLLIECTVFYQHFQLFDQDVPFFTNMYFISTVLRCPILSWKIQLLECPIPRHKNRPWQYLGNQRSAGVKTSWHICSPQHLHMYEACVWYEIWQVGFYEVALILY